MQNRLVASYTPILQKHNRQKLAMNETMKEIALAEKYQRKLAEENNATYAAYNYDGYDYEQLLKEHDVEIKRRVWDRVNVGNVTLVHDEVLKFDK